jgi:hypothetical protein
VGIGPSNLSKPFHPSPADWRVSASASTEGDLHGDHAPVALLVPRLCISVAAMIKYYYYIGYLLCSHDDR